MAESNANFILSLTFIKEDIDSVWEQARLDILKIVNRFLNASNGKYPLLKIRDLQMPMDSLIQKQKVGLQVRKVEEVLKGNGFLYLLHKYHEVCLLQIILNSKKEEMISLSNTFSEHYFESEYVLGASAIQDWSINFKDLEEFLKESKGMASNRKEITEYEITYKNTSFYLIPGRKQSEIFFLYENESFSNEFFITILSRLILYAHKTDFYVRKIRNFNTVFENYLHELSNTMNESDMLEELKKLPEFDKSVSHLSQMIINVRKAWINFLNELHLLKFKNWNTIRIVFQFSANIYLDIELENILKDHKYIYCKVYPQSIVESLVPDGYASNREDLKKELSTVRTTPNIDKPIIYSGSKPYIFISYAHKDSEVILEEIIQIKAMGFEIWYDERILPGNDWAEDIANGLKNCTVFLIFLTKHSVSSKNVADEINFALDNNKSFIAIYLEDIKLPPGLQLRMNKIQGIYKQKYTVDEYLKKLKSSLDVKLNG